MIKVKQTLESIRLMTVTALEKSAEDSAKEALKVKLERSVQKGSKNVHTYRKKRKDIARLKTVAQIKKLEGEQNGKA